MNNIEFAETLKAELKELQTEVGEESSFHSDFENAQIEAKHDILLDVLSLIERKKCIILLNGYLHQERFKNYQDLNKVLFVTKYGKFKHAQNPKRCHGFFYLWTNNTYENRKALAKICKNYNYANIYNYSNEPDFCISIEDLLKIPFTIENLPF